MKKAADALYANYKTDDELTSFTNLDFVDFYEAKWNLVNKSWPDNWSRD